MTTASAYDLHPPFHPQPGDVIDHGDGTYTLPNPHGGDWTIRNIGFGWEVWHAADGFDGICWLTAEDAIRAVLDDPHVCRLRDGTTYGRGNPMTPDLDDEALALFPIDGPHAPEKTIAAARTIAGLVRFLNHATQREHAVEYPSQLAAVIANLRSGLYGADQLVRQIRDHAVRCGQDPRLYDDRGGDALLTVAETVGALRTVAGPIGEAADLLGVAHEACNRLGIRDQTNPDEGEHR